MLDGMLEADLHLLRQRFLTWDCLVSLTMLVLALETVGAEVLAAVLSRTCIVTPMLLRMKPPQKDLCMARALSSCAAFQVPVDGRRFRLVVHVNSGLSVLISRVDKSFGCAAKPAQALGPC